MLKKYEYGSVMHSAAIEQKILDFIGGGGSLYIKNDPITRMSHGIVNGATYERLTDEERASA